MYIVKEWRGKQPRQAAAAGVSTFVAELCIIVSIQLASIAESWAVTATMERADASLTAAPWMISIYIMHGVLRKASQNRS